MIVQLNVLQNGLCAQIYACAEDHEEGFPVFFYSTRTSFSYSTRTIKIWHNNNMRSMQTHVPLPKNCDNDFFVKFKSSVPFKEFCRQFRSSEYDDPGRYHFFKHNCANAANHALKLAKIELGITDSLRLSRFNPNSIIKIPSTLLTPGDIYHIAKKHKINELMGKGQYVSSIYFKIELATAKLAFLAKEIDDDRIKNSIKTIVSEIEHGMQARTHHAEFYLKVLIDTIDIVMQLPNENDIEDYQNLSSYLKERELSRTLRMHNPQFILTALLFLLRGIESLAGIEEDWRFTYFLSITVAIIGCGFISGMFREGADYTPTIKNHTKLSQAMLDLAACVEEKDLFTLI